MHTAGKGWLDKSDGNPCQSMARAESTLTPSPSSRVHLPTMRAIVLVTVCICSALLCFAAHPSRPHQVVVAGTAVEILPDRISLLDGSGKVRDSWDPAPFAVQDACADPARPFLYLVLGKPRAKRGERLAVVALEGQSFRLVFLDRDRQYNPWKVLAGDVDGDGTSEVLFAVYKKSRFHPVFANRLFVFGWDGHQLYPKWLGSRLSRPFFDLALAKTEEHACELLALEAQEDGGRRIMSYRWCGFGFEGDKELAQGTPTLCLRDLGY